MLRSAGVTGEITNDAKNPVTGVYFNEMQASKMDWYIQRKSTVKRTGDNTYHVTYSFTNTLQPGEAGSLLEYITANAKGGVAVNRVVIYTPAGGEVSNVSASNGSSFAQVQAEDHMTYGRHLPGASGHGDHRIRRDHRGRLGQPQTGSDTDHRRPRDHVRVLIGIDLWV